MNSNIKLLADKYLFHLEECLPEEVTLNTYDPADGLPGQIGTYDALIVRTVTPVNSSTIPASPENLKFIASATSGTDHVDTEYLEQNGISFRYAGGCNALSVAEYAAVVLLIHSSRNQINPEDLKVGIVGVGHAGSTLADLLESLDIPYLAFDPPRDERSDDFVSCTLEELLGCDILTFHTPLTHSGKYSTYHWLDQNILETHSFNLIINTSRGGVVDEKALYKAFQSDTVQEYVLDVWENEPMFNDLVANKAFFKTPHIAGYSLQSKWRASVMVAEELASFFDLPLPDSDLPGHLARETDTSFLKNSPLTLEQVLTGLHPIARYNRNFKQLIGKPPKTKKNQFQKLRTGFPLRNEFNAIHLQSGILEMYPVLGKLGFNPE